MHIIDWILKRTEYTYDCIKNDTIHTESADKLVHVCPVCHEGWSPPYGNDSLKAEWFGDWWNLKRGKELKECPKCQKDHVTE